MYNRKKGRPKETFKYKHPIDNEPMGVYSYRIVMNFLKKSSKNKFIEEIKKIKGKKGRPTNSFKYRDDRGRPIGVFEWRRTTHAGKINKRAYFIKSKYNITLEEYKKMENKQKGVCAICKKPFISKIHIDHSHETKKVRGLLCLRCNLLLGNAGDNIELLKNAIQYLQESI